MLDNRKLVEAGKAKERSLGAKVNMYRARAFAAEAEKQATLQDMYDLRDALADLQTKIDAFARDAKTMVLYCPFFPPRVAHYS
jgi:hypothetical protein